MGPPSFWELPKDIDDLITSGYFRDVLKLDIKTKTKSGIKFNFGGEESLRDKDVLGFLEVQYEFNEYGVTFKENWNTDNILSTALTIEEYIQGVKWTCETNLYPDKWPREDPSESNPTTLSGRRKWNYGDKMLRLETKYTNDFGCLTFESVFSASKVPRVEVGPVIKGGAVCDFHGLMVGCGLGIDVGARTVLDCILGIHFENDGLNINAFVTNAKIFSASFSQKFLDGNFECGVTSRWSLDDPDVKEFRTACRIKVDEDTTISFKLDNFKYVGIGLSQTIRKGVKFFVSFMANGMHLLNGNLYEDYHFGACLELGDGSD